MRARDPLAIGLGALVCGVAFGAASLTACNIILTIVGEYDGRDDLLFAGVVVGILVAAVSAWRLSRPLDNVSQRGVVCVLSVFGALGFGFIFTILARQAFGLGGLAMLALALVAIGSAAARWAVRGRGVREEGEP